jgi:integrase
LPVKVIRVAPPPTDAEIDRLLEAIGRPTPAGQSRQWAVDFCVGLVELGGRFSEVAGLRVEDVTLHREQRARGEDVTGHVRIHRQLKDETTKRRKTVTVPISERLYTVLERLCDGRQPDDLVFTTPTGRGITNSRWHRDVWPQAIAAAGLNPELRPHDCRHAFGTKLANTPGVSITTVKELMGHSDIRTTMGYVHVAEGHLVDAIRKAEAHRVLAAQSALEAALAPEPEAPVTFDSASINGEADITPSL